MQRQEFIEQIAELSARIKRIERWQDQWSSRNRKVSVLHASRVESSGGYLVSSAVGLAANFHKELNPPRRIYRPGLTGLATFSPRTGYHSIIPAWWEIPRKAGNVSGQIVFIYSDGTAIIHPNHGSATLKVVRSDLVADKDGLTITEIRIEAWNQANVSETRNLGRFKFAGEQV